MAKKGGQAVFEDRPFFHLIPPTHKNYKEQPLDISQGTRSMSLKVGFSKRPKNKLLSLYTMIRNKNRGKEFF